MDEKINPNFTYLQEKIEDNRWVLLQGSTRSGKTYSIIHFIINLCYKYQGAGLEIDIVRDTFKALKSTFWKDFKTVLTELEIWSEDLHHKTDHIYELYGNVINYYGADDPQKVHGRSRDILIINEANHIDEETIDQLSPRTRHRIICDFNPALGLEHWLDKYIDNYGVLITTYKDNPFLTPSQVEDIESKRGNPYWWSVYGEGKRAKVQGAVFENWEEGELDLTDSWFGMDFGYSNDPTTLVQVSIDKKKRIIYAKELLYETHLTTSQIADICLARAKGLIIADSAEPRLIHEIKSKGVNIQGAKKVSINEGVMLMNDYNMIVQGHNLKKELSMYRWADKGKTVPIDAHNHCFTGDTLITTLLGEKRIRDIEVGDIVPTSNGFNQVLKKWENGFKKVSEYSMQFDTFSLSLRSTKNHKVKTNNGWKEIAKLQRGEKITLHKYFLERNIDSIQTKIIFREVLKGFIELYGNITTGQYKKGMIFTTLTVILQTTELKTLIWFREFFMLGMKVRRGLRKTLNTLKHFTTKALKLQKSGIKAKKEESGTVNTEKRLGLIDLTERLIVKSVVRSTRQDMEEFQSSATITARLKHLDKGEETRELVYDLMIENEHEYFANGVLVHNCIDALRYAVIFYASRPNYGKYAVG